MLLTNHMTTFTKVSISLRILFDFDSPHQTNHHPLVSEHIATSHPTTTFIMAEANNDAQVSGTQPACFPSPPRAQPRSTPPLLTQSRNCASEANTAATTA